MASGKCDILIIGGGPAGLAAAYAARQKGRSAVILEADTFVGGLCRTFQLGSFRYDSGAHRLHDRDAFSTELVKGWLGDRLMTVDRPSMIFDAGRCVRFPLAAHELARHLGVVASLRAAMDLARARLLRPRGDSFEHTAVRTYGRLLAERYLLNYSRKLWGASCDTLCPSIAGKRLKGLNLAHVVRSAMPGRRAAEHLEGRFYYPAGGIGAITDHMAQSLPSGTIHTHAQVTRILHAAGRITRVETADGRAFEPEQVISTIRLDHLVMTLAPDVPEFIANARALGFRAVVLVMLALKQPMVSHAATTYFPAEAFLFNRAYEPRNRCASMAPAGETSLCFEIACEQGDAVWNAPDEHLLAQVMQSVCDIRWVADPGVVSCSAVHRLPAAYPVLTLAARRHAAELLSQLRVFENLQVIGRSGQYQYAWIHDMLRAGHSAVATLCGEATCASC